MIKYPIISKNNPNAYIMVDEQDVWRLDRYKIYKIIQNGKPFITALWQGERRVQIRVERIIYEWKQSRKDQPRLLLKDGDYRNLTRENIVPYSDELAVDALRRQEKMEKKQDSKLNGNDWANGMMANIAMREEW